MLKQDVHTHLQPLSTINIHSILKTVRSFPYLKSHAQA